jgi:hypothetical protein
MVISYQTILFFEKCRKNVMKNLIVIKYSDQVREVKAITASGLQQSFRGKKIVLCAGTLDSPALLLRSGIEVQPSKVEGKGKAKEKKTESDTEGEREERGPMRVPKYTGVTDHNIYGFRFTIKGGGGVSPAKLQLEGEVSTCAGTQAGGAGEKGDKKIPFLLNICINAHSFLSRDFEEEADERDGVCTLTYEFRATINNQNYMALDVYTGEPILHIKNSGEEAVRRVLNFSFSVFKFRISHFAFRIFFLFFLFFGYCLIEFILRAWAAS